MTRPIGRAAALGSEQFLGGIRNANQDEAQMQKRAISVKMVVS